jgi:hypothetical protein
MSCTGRNFQEFAQSFLAEVANNKEVLLLDLLEHYSSENWLVEWQVVTVRLASVTFVYYFEKSGNIYIRKFRRRHIHEADRVALFQSWPPDELELDKYKIVLDVSRFNKVLLLFGLAIWPLIVPGL